MKNLRVLRAFFNIAVVIYILSFLPTMAMSNENFKLRIGMTPEAFREILPGVLPEDLTFNKTLEKTETIHGLEGLWSFVFIKDKLDSVSFRSSGSPLNVYRDEDQEEIEESFDKYKAAALEIIKVYEARYGMSVSVQIKGEEFEHPEKYDYKQTPLISAVWEYHGERIELKMSFHGVSDNPYMMNAPKQMYFYELSVQHRQLKDKISDNYTDKFYVGMRAKEFASSYPELIPDGALPNGQWMGEETLYGLKGAWHYTFKQGKLDWFSFSFYFNEPEELTENNFKICLTATQKLIKEYTEKYGKPTNLTEGDLHFRDPFKEHHWGYDVLKATWLTPEMKFKIEFIFFGGKGDYFFGFTMKFFNKDYPYFD